MKAVVRRPLSGRAATPDSNAPGTVARAEHGCVKVRPSVYETKVTIGSLENVENAVLAAASSAFTLWGSLLTTTEGVRLDGSSALVLSSEAEASVFHHASARAVSVLTVGNKGSVETPNEMESHFVIDISGEASVIYGAKAAGVFEIETEGAAAGRYAAQGDSVSMLSLPGDASEGRARTIGEMDGSSLGDYDGDTLGEIDWIPGEEGIDPIIIHGGGE